MSRVLGKAAPDDDEETRLDRDFTLPDARHFRVYGVVRPDRAAPDEVLDSRQGVDRERRGDLVVAGLRRLRGSRLPSVRR